MLKVLALFFRISFDSSTWSSIKKYLTECDQHFMLKMFNFSEALRWKIVSYSVLFIKNMLRSSGKYIFIFMYIRPCKGYLLFFKVEC